MKDKEIFELFNSSSSKTELCNKLNLDIIHKNSIYIDNVLKDIMHNCGFEIDITSNGFKQRRLERERKKWEEEKPVCKNCGKSLSFEKRKNRFCSESCAASYNNSNRILSDETKKNISDKLKKYYKFNSSNITKKIKDPKYYIRICKVCGKEFSVEHDNTIYKSKRTICSIECKKKFLSDNGKLTYKKLKEEGRFQGWKSRNITSYAEKFWISVLDNNGIQYQREKKVGKYFIDFYITKNDNIIDLEIDGKQHKYQDRKDSDIERDEYLSSLGIIVYRVEWNSINTEEGSSKMKLKIDEFLNFYNTMRE